MDEYFAYTYMCAPCACSTLDGQKRALGLLELELQIALSYHLRTGMEPRPSVKATGALKVRAIISAPTYFWHMV